MDGYGNCMMREIKYKLRKVRPASQSYGRGPDNVYQPAAWALVLDGVDTAYFQADAVRYMEPVEWHTELAAYDRTDPKRSQLGPVYSLRYAKAKAIALLNL